MNNAGIGHGGYPVTWMTTEGVRQLMDVNLFSHIDLIQTFLPMLETGKGRIVTVTSALGRLGTPTAAAYCASKFAAEALSDAFRCSMQISQLFFSYRHLYSAFF